MEDDTKDTNDDERDEPVEEESTDQSDMFASDWEDYRG